MRTATRFSVDSLLHGLSRVGAQTPDARRRHSGIRVWKNIPYTGSGSAAHTLDVFKADWVTGPAPALVYIHGGGFAICSKDTHWTFALPFARRGFVVFNINYRLSPRHKYPSAFHDACDAFLWVQSEGARRYGADPEQIVLAGESAGANLATAVSAAAVYPADDPVAKRVFAAPTKPRATVAACGLLQVSDPARFERRRPERPRWQKRVLAAIEQAYIAGPEAPFADPLLFFERETPVAPPPPFYILSGTRDFLLHDSRRLKASLDKLEVPSRLRVYPQEVHGFHAFPWREAAHNCWGDQHAFLSRFVSLETPPEHSAARQDLKRTKPKTREPK